MGIDLCFWWSSHTLVAIPANAGTGWPCVSMLYLDEMAIAAFLDQVIHWWLFLLGTWHYRVSVGTGWPGVSVLYRSGWCFPWSSHTLVAIPARHQWRVSGDWLVRCHCQYAVPGWDSYLCFPRSSPTLVAIPARHQFRVSAGTGWPGVSMLYLDEIAISAFLDQVIHRWLFLPDTWHYRVSAGTGWPGISTQWLGEGACLIVTSISVWLQIKFRNRAVPETR